MTVFYICIFGVLGVLARYGVNLGVAAWISHSFPLATLTVNLLGAFLVGGAYVAGMERLLFSAEIRVGLMVGFLGGFTTFSSYCLEAVRLAEEGHWVPAVLYFAGSPVLGAGSTVIGMALARKLLGTG